MITPQPKENTACPIPTCLGWMMRHLKGVGMAAAIKSQLKQLRFERQEEKEPSQGAQVQRMQHGRENPFSL